MGGGEKKKRFMEILFDVIRSVEYLVEILYRRTRSKHEQ